MSREWLFDSKEKIEREQEERHDLYLQKMAKKYGPVCPVCGWNINHPVVQYVDHPGKTHDCFTGDPMAR